MKISFLLCAGLLACACNRLVAEDFESLSKSPVWQVRYCCAAKFDTPTLEARRVLERLSVDETRGVASQAFACYSRMFVSLDRAIVKKAFARGDFDLVGIKMSDRRAFERPEFWMHELDSSSEVSIRARAVRALGMCGSSEHVAGFSKYPATNNPHLLIELAVAFHRLGDDRKYLEAIDAILALPIKDAFYYQNCAVDCLIQTHPERARSAWKRIHEEFGHLKDGQPNWVYAHIVQEARLP